MPSTSNKKELDFDAFARAIAEADLNSGLGHAACHHSAVNVKDWDLIQKRLEEAVKFEDEQNDATQQGKG